MNKNKRNFYIGQIGSGIIFSIGVLYLLIPTYYGLDNMVDIDTNNLFMSLVIIYACIQLGFYYIIGANPTNESLLIGGGTVISGVLNIVFNRYLGASTSLALSVLVFTVLITLVRILTIEYYKKKKDAYYYIEEFLTTILFVTGVIISISLFNDPLVQTIELGFLLIILGILESMKVAMKCLLKAPRFLGRIKF